jgi:hypothetical protein
MVLQTEEEVEDGLLTSASALLLSQAKAHQPCPNQLQLLLVSSQQHLCSCSADVIYRLPLRARTPPRSRFDSLCSYHWHLWGRQRLSCIRDFLTRVGRQDM